MKLYHRLIQGYRIPKPPPYRGYLREIVEEDGKNEAIDIKKKDLSKS